jgi:hypothetical protein
MDLLKLLRDRHAGWVKITFAKNYNYDLKEVMARVGLSNGPSEPRKVSQEEAIDTMTAILWRDMAYRVELIDKEQAHQRALKFVGEYALAGAEFYNNLFLQGERDRSSPYEFKSHSFSEFSDSTFNMCLLIVNPDSAVCVLAEDED